MIRRVADLKSVGKTGRKKIPAEIDITILNPKEIEKLMSFLFWELHSFPLKTFK
jgi:hypothetical protein